MARRNTHELAFTALSIEGGLLAPDFLNKVARLEASGQTESDYDIPRGLKLRDEIGRYWKIAQNLWQDFTLRSARTDVDSHALTVREFLEPFCRQVLGFSDLRAVGQVVLDERIFPIGYAAAEGRVPLVFAPFDQILDKPATRFGDGVRRRSPFLLAQEYLNANPAALWAVVSNGRKLRILRDNPSLTRPAYIEADLEAIFSEGLYPDFTALWLLVHATRFLPSPQKRGAEVEAGQLLPSPAGRGAGGEGITPSLPPNPADCPLEVWRNTAQEDGIRARERLRIGVTLALRALGTGFLAHPANASLRHRLETGELTTQAYFEQLLRLVYRFIFLATIEDRELIFAPDACTEAKARYQAGYSLARLRRLAARRRSYDRHSDLWQVLNISFAGLGRGQPALGLPALGGLFDAGQCPDLEASSLENQALLAALFSLCFFREGAVLSRVNYRDMDSEELGSVYESLLELVPVATLLGGAPKFGFVGDEEEGSNKGNARKLTGSYYTPDSLVQELIKSALEPVIVQTLKDHPQQPVQALLSLSVCDPACGSGYFLLAAARRIAEEVARLNAADGNPLPADYRHALRDVIAHCIYGVDKNPMAVELARTALWLEAYSPDRPLTFLDHHLRCGDALLGVLDPNVLENGIPEEAYAVLSGDDKEVAKRLKAENRIALKSLQRIQGADLFADTRTTLAFAELETLADDTLAAIEQKRRYWLASRQAEESSPAAQLADTYVAAFLMPKTAEHEGTIPLSGYFWQLAQGQAANDEKLSAATRFCRSHQVFHWWLAFPHIHARGGFDVLLGNPPWERIKLQEEEFFASRSPLVAAAQHKAERGRRIELLKEGMLLHTLYPEVEAAQGLMPPNPAEQQLHAEFLAARRGAEAASLFAHDSGRYPLTGVGDVNTYALFAEAFAQLVSPTGRTGFIVPTGIATDDSTKAYFADLAVGAKLVSIRAFENESFIFPSVHHAFKFVLLTTAGTVQANPATFVFLARHLEQIQDARRRFSLTADEFLLINPNTRTCPVFRSQYDAELTKKLYRAAPVLIEEGAAHGNPWGIRFQAMFHMSADSHLFRNDPGPSRLPLFEAKMLHQFDHRWATYVDAPGKPDGLDTEDCTCEQKSSPEYTVRPRYWVEEREVLARIANVPARVARAWLATKAEDLWQAVAEWLAASLVLQALPVPPFELEDKSSAWLPPVQQAESRLRTAYPALYQRLAAAKLVGKKAYTDWPRWARAQCECPLSDEEQAGLTTLRRDDALFSLLDEWMDQRSPRWLMGWRNIARSTDERSFISSVIPKVSVGHSMPLFHLSQSPVRAAAYLANMSALVFDFVVRQKLGGTNMTFGYYKQFPVLPPDRYTEADLDFIVPRVLELTYTAHDLQPWAADLGFDGTPFPWNPDRRAILRAELDAHYARLYGLTRDELRYILDPADVLGADYPSETFRVLKNNEIREFGEYRTRNLVLHEFDRMTLADAQGQPYASLLVSPPGEAQAPVYSPHGAVRDAVDAHLAGLLLTMIRLGGSLLRSRLTYAIRILELPQAAQQSLFGAEEWAALNEYQGQHATIFEADRITGDRLQTLLRHFESSGAIRFEQQGALLVATRNAPSPSGLIFEEQTEQLASVLLRVLAQTMECSETRAEEQDADPSVRRA